MQIVSDGKIEGKILSIEHIDGLIYRLIAATSSDDNRLFWFSVKGNKALDITSGNWEGSDLIGAGVGELKLSTDLHSLLPKLPHYLASLFGNRTVVEKEYTYGDDGKIKYRDIITDFTEPQMILYHKDVFPYKFSEPLFFVDRIATRINKHLHLFNVIRKS